MTDINIDTASRVTRVYRYGCCLPVEGAALVDEQIRLAHRYRNKLTEIERARRLAVREVQAAANDLAPLVAQLATLESQIEAAKAARAVARKQLKTHAKRLRHGVSQCDLDAEIEAARAAEGAFSALCAQAKALRGEIATARRALREDPEVVAVIQAVRESSYAAIRAARAQFVADGLFWGTYLLVERAAAQAASGRNEPRFRRFTGEGQIGVQLQKGLTVAAALAGTDTRLRIEPVRDDGRPCSRRHNPEEGIGRTRVWLRVGSDGRAPVWTVFPVVMHRPLPETGIIKWATVQRRNVGTFVHHDLCLTVECEAPPRLDLRRLPVVAVDLGWRRVDDGEMRTAYWLADDGQRGELRLPADLTEKLAHARSIGAIRQRAFNEFLPTFVAWVTAAKANSEPLPEWFIERTATLAQWVAPNRLYALSRAWSQSRFDPDVAIWPQIEAWKNQDRHLRNWCAYETRKVLTRRDDLYRNWAAQIVRSARLVVAEAWNVRASMPALAMGGARQIAAPGRLRDCVRKAAVAYGREYVEVDPAGTTRTCHRCGCDDPWDAAPHVDHECARCGVTWDQDHNACANLLRRQRDANASGGVACAEPEALASANTAPDQEKPKRRGYAKRRRATVAV